MGNISLPPGADLYGGGDVMEFRVTGDLLQHTQSSKAKTGVLHTINVPRKATQRFIWIACDALRSSTIAPWYIDAKIVFWLNNSKVSEFPISSGNALPPGRGINIMAPYISSGMQPALKATALDSLTMNCIWDGTYMQNIYGVTGRSVQMPCFAFNVERDKITLEVAQMSRGGIEGTTKLTLSQIAALSSGEFIGGTTASPAAGLCKWKIGKLMDNFAYLKVDNNVAIKIGSGIYSTLEDNGFIAGNTVGPDLSVNGVGDIVKFHVDHIRSSAVALANYLLPNYTALPTGNGVGQWAFTPASLDPNYLVQNSGPNIYCEMDGMADLMTGLVVANQYPGGL